MRRKTVLTLFFLSLFIIPSYIAQAEELSGKEDSSVTAAVLTNTEGVQFLNSSEFDKAEDCFRKAIKLDPLQSRYYNNLAVSFMRRKNYKDAHVFLLQAIAMNDRYAKALSNMAITCFYLGYYMDAYKYYLRAEDSDKTLYRIPI